MDVTLSPDLEELIDDRMSSGLYASVTEVLRDALRLLADRERTREDHSEELRTQIARGLEQLDRGERERLDIDAIRRKARQLHLAQAVQAPG